MNPIIKKYFPTIVCLYLALQFSSMAIWARMMRDSFSTGQQVFSRLIFALVLSLILFHKQFSKKIIKNIPSKEWAVYITRAVLYYGIGVMLFTIAVNNSDLGFVSFVSSIPIMGVLGWIFFREKIRPIAILYILISLIGLILLAKISLSDFKIDKNLIVILIMTLAFDISWIMAKAQKLTLNNFQQTTLVFSFAWIIPLIYTIANGENIFPSSISMKALVGLIMSGTLNIAGLYIGNYVYTNLKAYVAGNILLIQGAFSLLLGYIFYSESFSVGQFIGAAIIAICAIIISRIDHKEEIPIAEN